MTHKPYLFSAIVVSLSLLSSCFEVGSRIDHRKGRPKDEQASLELEALAVPSGSVTPTLTGSAQIVAVLPSSTQVPTTSNSCSAFSFDFSLQYLFKPSAQMNYINGVLSSITCNYELQGQSIISGGVSYISTTFPGCPANCQGQVLADQSKKVVHF